MENFDVNVFENVADIDKAIKDLRVRRKELKAEEVKAGREAVKEEKARVLEEAKANMVSLGLEEGADIRFVLKGEEVAGKLVKMTDARFVALVGDEKKTLPFDKFVGLVEADTADTETDEE